MTSRQISATEFGDGIESAGAEQEMWDNLPTMKATRVERIVRMALIRDRYGLLVAAVRGATKERVAEIKSRFNADELSAMLN